MGRGRRGGRKAGCRGRHGRAEGKGALPAGAVCSAVLPEEAVTGHREGSHQHHILLEVHLPVSVLIQLLHHLVHRVRVLLGLRVEETER